MAERDVPFGEYVQQVTSYLAGIRPERRAEIEAELRTHLEDAAAEHGPAPDAVALQRSVLRRLGSGRRLGRALAAANGEPQPTGRARMLYLVGGLGVLLSGATFVGGVWYSSFEERSGEFWMTVAPLLLLPTVLALFYLMRPAAPRLRGLALACGLISLMTYLGVGLLAYVVALLDLTLPINGMVLLTPIVLIGVWMALTGYLMLTQSVLGNEVLGCVGIVVGCAWFIGLGSLFVNAFSSTLITWLSPLIVVNIVVWILGHTLWSVWLGGLLLAHAIRPPRLLPG